MPNTKQKTVSGPLRDGWDDLYSSLEFTITLHKGDETTMCFVMNANNFTMAISDVRDVSGQLIANSSDYELVVFRSYSNGSEQSVVPVADYNTISLGSTASSSRIIIRAKAYRRFKVVLGDIDSLVELYPPSMFAKWDMCPLAACENLTKLVMTAGGTFINKPQDWGYPSQILAFTGRSNYPPLPHPSELNGLSFYELWNEPEDYVPGINVTMNIGSPPLLSSLNTLHIAGSYARPLPYVVDP